MSDFPKSNMIYKANKFYSKDGGLSKYNSTKAANFSVITFQGEVTVIACTGTNFLKRIIEISLNKVSIPKTICVVCINRPKH